MKIAINATLTHLGSVAEIGVERGAVLACRTDDDCRALAPVLLRTARFEVHVEQEAEASRASMRVPLLGRKCPECGAPVTVLCIEDPAVFNVLVDPEPFDSVALRSDGAAAMCKVYRPHAASCPSWPDDQRDWRLAIPTSEDV